MRTYLYYIIRLMSKTVRADETTAHKQYGPEALYTHTVYSAKPVSRKYHDYHHVEVVVFFFKSYTHTHTSERVLKAVSVVISSHAL